MMCGRYAADLAQRSSRLKSNKQLRHAAGDRCLRFDLLDVVLPARYLERAAKAIELPNNARKGDKNDCETNVDPDITAVHDTAPNLLYDVVYSLEVVESQLVFVR